jgi:hypothetical protein
VRYAWATKAEAYAAVAAQAPDRGIVVAVGDDETDEELFERLAPDDWTIKVGRGPTAARWSVDGPDDVLAALDAIADGILAARPRTSGRRSVAPKDRLSAAPSHVAQAGRPAGGGRRSCRLD